LTQSEYIQIGASVNLCVAGPAPATAASSSAILTAKTTSGRPANTATTRTANAIVSRSSTAVVVPTKSTVLTSAGSNPSIPRNTASTAGTASTANTANTVDTANTADPVAPLAPGSSIVLPNPDVVLPSTTEVAGAVVTQGGDFATATDVSAVDQSASATSTSTSTNAGTDTDSDSSADQTDLGDFDNSGSVMTSVSLVSALAMVVSVLFHSI
jgi:hypothetical protein